MPSPAMATTRPSLCRRFTTSSLLLRPDPCLKFSDPQGAGCAFRCALAVPGQHDDTQPARAKIAERLRSGRLDGIGNADHSCGSAVDGDEDDSLPLAAKFLRLRASKPRH